MEKVYLLVTQELNLEFYVDNTSLGFAVVANGTTASSGLLFIGQNNRFKHSM
jgi:hypothetical protein